MMEKWINKCHVGDCREVMKQMIAEHVQMQMCVTSPPYWGLRDYGIVGQLGMEETPEEYVNNLVEVFNLVKQLLTDNGTLWLILGDSYAGSGCGTNDYRTEASRSINKSDVMFNKKPPQQRLNKHGVLKPKDLVLEKAHDSCLETTGI